MPRHEKSPPHGWDESHHAAQAHADLRDQLARVRAEVTRTRNETLRVTADIAETEQQQLRITRARLTKLRGAGLDADGQPDTTPDVVKQVQEQLIQARERIGHLETALASNRRIGIAIGIVMARHGVTDEVAFELLRERSQLLNEKLRELAEEVIYTGTF